MAPPLSSRIAAARAKRQPATGGTSTLQARLARARQRKGAVPDEEEEDRGFWDRLYYGEEKGEGGAMGLEEVPGQFLEVAGSPIEKGLKPLVALGTGVAKMPFADEEDEDVRLARTVGKQLYKSVAELPEAIAGGYPAEGLMNVAAVPAMFATGGAAVLGAASKIPKLGALAKASEGLTKLSRTPGMRAVAAAADPLTAAAEGLKLARKAAPGVAARAREIGLPAIGAAAVERLVDPAKEIGRAAAEKATRKPKAAAKAAGQFRKEMTKPGRKVRTEVLDYIQSFLTSLPQHAVTKMYEYIGDAQNYQTMIKAANKPKQALKEVHERLAAAIRQKQRSASESYGRDRRAFFHKKPKTKDKRPNYQESLESDLRSSTAELPWRLNRVLNEALSDGAQGFGARVVVKFFKRDKDGKRVYEAKPRELDAGTQAELQRKPKQEYEYDVEFESTTGAGSTLSDAERTAVRSHIRNNLLKDKSPELPLEELLNADKRFMDSNPLKDRDLRVQDVLVLRLHKAVTGATESHLRNIGKAKDADEFARLRKAYEAHKGDMEQVRATYGDAPEGGIVTDASAGRLEKALHAAESTEALERLISKGGIVKLIGAMSSKEFGGGLVVKSDISKRLAAVGAATAGGFAIGPLGIALGGLPLLMIYSPRMMLPLSNRLANSPRFMKMAGRGPGAQKEAQKQVSKLMKVMREAREVLGNDTVQKYAQQGMTVGQFMERLQQAQQREEQQ